MTKRLWREHSLSPGEVGPYNLGKRPEFICQPPKGKAMARTPLVPQEIFFTKGVGRHQNRLQSFELALRHAGIEKGNLVRVSSIFPPTARIVTKSKGLEQLRAGEITYVVLAETSTDEPSRLVGAGIGLALPARGEQYGYISEHHGYGMTEERLGDFVEDMAATMLATTLGIEFDPNTAYDERKEIYKMSGRIIKTRNVVQTAEGDKNGLWTTVVAGAVMLL
jgi:arginine decarboxylase